MPRIHSTKTTTLYLPSANPKTDREPVTLEVLIMAHKIARDRGNVFDIEAFMPESLREQWEAMKRGEEWPKRENVGGEGNDKEDGNVENGATGTTEMIGHEGGLDGQNGVANGATTTDGTDNVPANDTTTANTGEVGDTAATSQTTDLDVAPTSTTDTQPTTDIKPIIEPPAPAKQPFKLTPSHPALLNMHWKQRQKRLAQLAARDAAIEKGLVPEYFPELEALIRLEEEKEREKEREVEAGQKRKRGMSTADIEGIRHSASHWNHLLVEARRMRGPQWDYNTQQFLVDRSSEDYYTHMKPPRSDTIIKQDPQVMNGNTHATPSSSQSANRSLPTRQSSSPVKPPMGMMQPPPGPQDQRRMSMTGNQQASQSGPSNPGYHPSPHQQQQQPQQHPQMYNQPPNQYQQQQQQQQQQQHQQQHQQQQQQQHFNPAQFLAMQQQQQQQIQQQSNPNQNPNQSPGMMNPALLMQAQQRLQAQARGQGQGQGQGQGGNVASLMAGHGHNPLQGQGQGQGQAPVWNPNMGLSPAMMQSMGVGMGGGGSTGGPMLGGGNGWPGGQ